jgi:hypothetical protein
MRDTSKHCARSRGLILAGLTALMVLAAACQSGGSDNNPAPGQDSQAANARGGTETQDEQPKSAVATNSANAANSGGGGTTAPSIQITVVPPEGAGPDRTERIAGTVSGVKNVKDYKVVLFAHTNKWYVEPDSEAPYTDIREDGTWENETYLGSEYAALLVKNSYKPPATTRMLPDVSGDVLAIKKAAAKK